jgi:hypothetical protein
MRKHSVSGPIRVFATDNKFCHEFVILPQQLSMDEVNQWVLVYTGDVSPLQRVHSRHKHIA